MEIVIKPGKVIQSYRFEHPIGSGAYGVVWQGRHELMGLPVAIKVIDTRDLGTQNLERVRQECRIGGQLTHREYVVEVRDAFVDELLALAQDAGVEPGVRQLAAGALERLGRMDEAVEAWLALARDAEAVGWTHGVAARKLGQLAGQLPPEQGFDLARLSTTLDPRRKSDEDILQHLAWGMQEAQWSNPQSATWLLPLVEGTFEDRQVYHALRDVAWEALAQLAPLADQAGAAAFQSQEALPVSGESD
jgi:hypothetical protein